MDHTAAKIVVTVPEPGKRTVLTIETHLPCMPTLGATLTVECGDEPLPLIVELASFNITRGDLFVSAHLPDVERELADGRSQPLKAPEMIGMLTSAGFTVTEVRADDERPRSRRRRQPK